MSDLDQAQVEDSPEDKSSYPLNGEEEDDVWLGEPSAHLNHVVAYHQVVREQMQATVEGLEKVHKEVFWNMIHQYSIYSSVEKVHGF